MPTRLVLGAGPTALPVIRSLQGDHGDLLVVSEEGPRADALRDDGVSVTGADPTDAATLRALDIAPASVLVLGADPVENLGATRAAREVFPDALVMVTAGREATDAQRSHLRDLADRFVDPESVVTDWLQEAIGTDGTRVRRLQRILRDIAGDLAIVMHDNPDPDAIASAIGLKELAERAGCSATVCHYGTISHQENRAFVNLLEYDLRTLDPDDHSELEAFDGFALVDHSRPGVNDQLPADLPIDIVIDHHPPRVPVEGRFVDLRSGVGATSSLLVDYYRRFDIEIPEAVATGLLFGIRVDTRDFRREVSAEDFLAAAALLPTANMDTLARIEDPSVSAETLTTIGRAITNRNQEGSVLLSCVGDLRDRDALAQAADHLLNLEGVQATLVYGILDGTIYVSARARGADIDLGEALRDAFGQIGSAGGHADMAGAQIALGVLESVDDRDASLHQIVESLVSNRFIEAVEARSNRLLGVYADSVYSLDEFGSPLRADLTGEGATADGDESPADGDGPDVDEA